MLRRVSADAALYTLSNLLVRGLGFLLLPCTCGYLTPADYGRLDMLTVIGSLIAVVAHSRNPRRHAIRRRFERGPQDRREWVASAFWITLAAVGDLAAATVCPRPKLGRCWETVGLLVR